MNEGVIVSSYENFFGGNSLPSDLAVEMAAVPTMHATIVADCNKDTLAPQSQNQHSRRFANSSTFNASFVSSVDCTAQNIVPAQMGFQCNNTNNNVGSVGGNNVSSNSFTQIPFVQIHTIDVQPQSAFNSTRFRRNASSNHEEIKAEPIKSENADNTKERVNATPTPPSSSQQRSECQTTKNMIQNDRVVYSVKNGSASLDTTQKNSNDVNAENADTCAADGISLTHPNIFRCQHCAFISLSERDRELHLENTHQENFRVSKEAINRAKIHCPGCENIFYTHTVLELHLREDHLMSEHDVQVLMQNIKKHNPNPVNGNATDNVKYSDLTPTNDTSANAIQRRSRIYLKNVECLREPNRDPIEQQDNLISDSLFHFDNDDCNSLENIGSISMEDQDLIGILTSNEATFNSKLDHNLDNISNDETLAPNVETNNSLNRPKQKISIKSVDVLREPSLVRRDYEIQSFGDFINTCSDLNLHITTNNNSNNIDKDTINSDNNTNTRVSDDCEQYKNFASAASEKESLIGGNSDASIVDFESDFVKPRRPKIYIKNVDILKEPMTFSNNNNAPIITETTSNNAMNFNYMQPTIPQTANSYLDPVDALNATVPSFNGGMSQLALGTISDQYLFDGGGANFLLNSAVPTNENYVYDTEPNSENFLKDTNRFTDTITPIITEPTPLTPPMATNISSSTNCTTDAQTTQSTAISTNVQKQKIFIKNVDILKEPQFQEPRGLLHLRTVDELNLMNRKEVENLIAPNLEGNQTNMPEEELSDNFACLKNASGEPLSTIENCNDANVIEDISYEGFKLNEFSTQTGWHDDYDLGEDIRDIITSTMPTSVPPSQKVIHELDTPQISLISIPDMEDLTGAGVHFNSESLTSGDTNLAANVDHQVNTDFTFDCEVITTDHNNIPEPICSSNNLISPIAVCNDEPQIEPESLNVVPSKGGTETLKKEQLTQTIIAEKVDDALPQKTKAINFDDIPPLTSMSSTSYTTNTTINTSATISVPSGLPVPPLVPMLPPIQFPKTVTLAAANANSATNPTERGRIYVANNLMQKPISNIQLKITSKNTQNLEKQQTKTPIAVSVMGGTSVRGRPFGSNRTGITKLRKQPPIENGAGIYLKCTVTGCAFRFKKSSTLDYHIKCHTSDPQPQSMVCPECKNSFTNWNSLHTHLWRGHKIDMELYSCELCSFKTPIYSRLLNTHSKIHYDERNYKCEQCEKAFKNTKQLKNHRRWHRNHNKSIATTTTSSSIAKRRENYKKCDATVSQNKDPDSLLPSSSTSTAHTTTTTTVPVTVARDFHRCKDCDAVFSHQKTLREHLCKNAAAAVQCTVCERVLTSRSSLKLHMQSHEPSHRFKCNVCDYSSSDHNAFRRHKMTHDNNAKMYACAHCDYKSIQSVSYQKHVQQKHPQVADSIVYKCKICTYSTINKVLFDIHQIKHENRSDKRGEEIATALTMDVDADGIEKSKQISQPNTLNDSVEQKTKIKVKSHFVLTTTTNAATEYNDLCLDAVTVPA